MGSGAVVAYIHAWLVRELVRGTLWTPGTSDMIE
jgi:hypothetical protein